MDYVSQRDLPLWIAAHVLAALSMSVGAGLFHSWLIAAGVCSAAALMARPMYRTIIPVSSSVIVRGQCSRRG
ncbi:hypothetical protein [Paraburkholderia humisilvae]|uniref:hypothetical protein n=1 Tax=Paraburkholderia humisilvae TaxID=627669 RepID=UPI001583FF4B|nr:hypothetical protein [Paraburkholderia humisilvae]